MKVNINKKNHNNLNTIADIMNALDRHDEQGKYLRKALRKHIDLLVKINDANNKPSKN